jgi:hypothetical protein
MSDDRKEGDGADGGSSPDASVSPFFDRINSADTVAELVPGFRALAEAIEGRSVTVTKAAVLALVKAKKANMKEQTGAEWWTKAAAVGLKAVLKAFPAGATGVVVLDAPDEGEVVMIRKPSTGYPRLARVVEVADRTIGGGALSVLVEVEMLMDDAHVPPIPVKEVRRFTGTALDMANAAMEGGASGPVNIGRMLEIGAVAACAEDADTMEAMCIGFFNAARGNGELKEQIVALGGVPMVIDCIVRFENNPAVLSAAFNAVNNLASMRYNTAKDQFAAGGVLPRVVAAMGRFVEVEEVQRTGCNVLNNMSVGHEANKVLIRQEGGIEAICRALGNFPDGCDFQKDACKALGHITQCSSAGMAEPIGSGGSIRSILRDSGGEALLRAAAERGIPRAREILRVVLGIQL